VLAARGAVVGAPFRVSARAALIGVLRARGNVAVALRAFEDARTLLREELGATPGPLLLELHGRLLRAEPRRAALPDRLTALLETPLVGRREPLEQLRAAARADGTAVVLVTGEGGIGKTRLIAEVVRESEGAEVLYGRCDEDELFPFGPWIEMLGTALTRVGDEELTVLLGEEGPEIARLLPELRSRLPGLAASSTTDPEHQLRRLYGAVIALLRRLGARRPLIAIIDDLHWADRSSLLLARHVVRALGAGSALLIGAYRDTDLSDRHPLVEVLADLERDGPLARIHLRGLDVTEIAAIAAADGHAVESAEEIREQTGGNPFFVKQLVRHLEESRTGTVSAGLRDVIVRRVARLGDEAGRVLRVAALLGREFDLRLLAPVVERGEDELLDDLDAAVKAGILWEGAPGRYTFVHALVRTALEHELSATRRALLHRRIGEAIEARYGERLDPWLAELTRHFTAAGPEGAERAVAYALRAAEQATGRVAYAEAAEFLQAALAVEPDDARLLHDLGLAQWRLGRAAEARETLERAADAARRSGAAELVARAALGHSGSPWAWFGNEDPASAHLLEQALARLPEADTPLRAQVLARLGAVLYFSSEAEARGSRLIESAIRMAHRVADDRALATALSAAQFAHWRPQLVDTRIALADELLHVVERIGTPEQVAEAWMWQVSALLTSCRRDDAEAAIARHAGFARRLGQPELLTHAASMRAMRLLLDGHWEEAAEAADEVRAIGGYSGLSLQEAGVVTLIARGEQLRLGELAEDLEAHARRFTELPAWRTGVAWAYAQAGRLDAARAELDVLRRDDFAMLPRDVNFDPGMAMLAHAAAELGDAALAAGVEPHLRPAAACWIVYGIGSATLGPVAYSLGLCSLLRGRVDAAVDDFELALAKSRQMRCRPYEAHASLGLASALERRGDAERAAPLRAAAVAVGEELGMTRLLRDAAQTASRRAPT
jgi:tetratricopeptide (TPR) repeat protein